MRLGSTLSTGTSAACQRWPQLGNEVGKIPPNEVCRRWIVVIRWRLRQTQRVGLDHEQIDGAYSSASELAMDVSVLLDSLVQSPSGELLAEEVRIWLDRIHTFGFHLARLDVRQDARQYQTVMNEILVQSRLCAAPEALTRSNGNSCSSTHSARKSKSPPDGLSETAQDTLRLFRPPPSRREVIRIARSGRTRHQHDTCAERRAHRTLVLATDGARPGSPPG